VNRTDQHPEERAAQEQVLRSVAFLRNLDRVDIARLIGAGEDSHFMPGAVIVREGDAADSLYMLATGTVAISVTADGGERSLRTISAPATFGEFGLLLAQRTATVRALTEVQAWRIPRDHFERLLRERPALGLAIAGSLAAVIDRRDRERVGAPLSEPGPVRNMSAPMPPRSPLARVISIGLAIGVPAALWFVPAPANLSQTGWHIAVVVIGGAIAWLLEPVPDFAVALGMAAAWGATGTVAPLVAFSGFASSAWVLAIAAFGITAAMASSGLLFRMALLLLRVFPPTHRGQVAALLFSGLILTPLVPAVLGRVATIAPVTREVALALGYARASRSSAAIAFAGVLGNTMLGPAFLTGVVTNFLIIALLPSTQATRFGWIGWLLAAAPAGIVLLLGSAITVIALDPRSASQASRAVRLTQEQTLGHLSYHERVTLAALAVFVFGLVLDQVVRVDIGVVGLLALLVAVVGGALDRQTFRNGIDWATVVLFGVLLGTGAVLRSGGVDRWIASLITPLTHSAGHPLVAIMIVALLGVGLRLVLPMVPTGFLLLVTLVPVAPQLGLSGWVVGFVSSVVAFTWIVPRQYEVLRMVREATEGEMFNDRQAVVVGMVITVIALLAILISIPYWQAMGIT
jgi:di/tricarboxylate transporter